MAKVFEGIDDHLRDWIARQPLFSVATAPLAGDGHVNASPKGPIGTLRVLDPRTIAYLDYIGSGTETIAHLRENGRIVVMLCAFEGPPRIVRLHRTGEVLTPADARFDAVFASAGFDQPRRRAGATRDRPRRAHADRGLVRIRRPAAELRGHASAHGGLGGQEAAHGRRRGAARLPAREVRRKS